MRFSTRQMLILFAPAAAEYKGLSYEDFRSSTLGFMVDYYTYVYALCTTMRSTSYLSRKFHTRTALVCAKKNRSQGE